MAALIWSPGALRDVQRLYRFLAAKNPDAAKRAVKAIRSGIKILTTHPALGRPAEEMEPGFLERMINFSDSGYIALYRYDGATVIILTVRHQKEAGY